MGWSGGSRVFNEVIVTCSKNVKNFYVRKELYKDLIEFFENEDWDTQDECLGQDKAFDKAIREMHPDWYKEE